MNTQPFLSIIIPVYNGIKNNLPKCLDSIWSQPLDKNLYEVICVDDCSKDDTRQWLKEEKKKHDNLRIIENKTNLRQGGARNRGVKEANGRYFLFIDQDDYYHPESIKQVYEAVKDSDIDILICDSAFQFNGYEHNNLQLNYKYHDVTDTENYIKQNGWAIAPWRHCIKLDFYIKSGIEFEENCRLEDIDWTIKLFYYAQKVQYQPILLIHYVKNNENTTDNLFRDKEILIANTIATNRALHLSDTLYKDSSIKNSIILLADLYYYVTCKNLLGMFASIKEKVAIIKLIEAKKSSNKYVRFAIKHPYIFAIISNITAPLYRIARKYHRRKSALKLQKGI